MPKKTEALFDPAVREKMEQRTLFQQAVRQFKHNKMAVLGLVIIMILATIVIGTIVIDIVTDNRIYEEYVLKDDLNLRLDEPSKEHPFGCDELGRDLFFRVIWGARLSLTIGIAAIMLSVLIGAPFGIISGYYGGKIDNIIMRFMDVLLSVPYIILAMAIVAALGKSTVNLLIALSISGIAKYARIARAAVMTVKDNEYVEAARAMGANDFTIMFKYILPNALAPILVQLSLGIGDSILAVAGLSFLGLGVQFPKPEWGAILTSARTYMLRAWHVSIFPGIALIISVIAFNLFGDGLRDALDPKLKR